MFHRESVYLSTINNASVANIEWVQDKEEDDRFKNILTRVSEYKYNKK